VRLCFGTSDTFSWGKGSSKRLFSFLEQTWQHIHLFFFLQGKSRSCAWEVDYTFLSSFSTKQKQREEERVPSVTWKAHNFDLKKQHTLFLKSAGPKTLYTVEYIFSCFKGECVESRAQPLFMHRNISLFLFIYLLFFIRGGTCTVRGKIHNKFRTVRASPSCTLFL